MDEMYITGLEKLLWIQNYPKMSVVMKLYKHGSECSVERILLPQH